MIERLSEPMIMVNPALLQHYHCALIKASPAKECLRFSKEDIQTLFKEKLSEEHFTWEGLLSDILICFENPFIDLSLSSNKNPQQAFLFYHSNLEKLTIRATALAYLFNQKMTIIYPKQQTESREIINIYHEKPLRYSQKKKAYKPIATSLAHIFELQNNLPQRVCEIQYGENYTFKNASVFSKMGLAARGEKFDEILENIYFSNLNQSKPSLLEK
ncbi:hypothetical protein ACWIUA_11505 [Ursidibacter sp. B-7004-1]